MKSIALKLDETIFREAEEILTGLDMSRNRYINEAVEHYNKIQLKAQLEEKIKRESVLVQEESLKVLKEFEKADGKH